MSEDVRGRLEGLLHQRQPAAPCTLSTGRGARTVCARRTREPEVAEATRPQHWRDGGGGEGGGGAGERTSAAYQTEREEEKEEKEERGGERRCSADRVLKSWRERPSQ